MAVPQLGVGARGPQGVVCPAAGAFDTEGEDVTLTELAPAMGAPDFR